jgi:hypothetical protein
MEKKNRPVQQAANSDIRTSDVTPPAPTTQVNHNADAGLSRVSQPDIADILNLYPDNLTPHNGAENMTIEKSRFNSEAAPQSYVSQKNSSSSRRGYFRYPV